MGSRDRAVSRATVPVHPRARPATVGKVYTGAATLEIVPLRAVEHREKFAIVEPVQLPLNTSLTVDETRVVAQVEQASAHPRFTKKRRSADEQPV